jgi:tripartite-type tricarboxylate transporter receptor subunit TctC
MAKSGLRFAAIAALVLAACSADAQEAYPTRPVRIVVPYPPGGATDITTRAFAQGISDLLGQQFYIEHKPGAGTNIGADYAARSAPDGYTLYVANFASHAVNRWLYKSLTYDPTADFVPVAMMVRGPMFLCVKPGLNVGSVAELVNLARQNPGRLSYGSPGHGSPNHIAAELLKHLTRIEVVHVPYRGAAPMNTDLLAGQIDYAFDASVIAHASAGKVKALGVGSAFRWPTDRDIPTIAESGVPGFDLTSFFAIVAPARTPAAIVQKLNDAIRTVAQRPDTAEKVAVTATIPFPATLQETQAFLKEQDTKWAPIVQASGIKVE